MHFLETAGETSSCVLHGDDLQIFCHLSLSHQAGLVAISLRAHTRSLSSKISDGRSPTREAREQRHSCDLVADVLRASKSLSYGPSLTVFRSRSAPRREMRAGSRELAVEKEKLMGAKPVSIMTLCDTCYTSHTLSPQQKCVR